MSSLNKSKFTESGFTAAEMVVATAVMAILGIVFLNVLNSGMILYAKNTSVNSAHEEARQGINRFTRDLHAAISVPQLRNNTHAANYTCGTYECGDIQNTSSFAVVSSSPVNGVAPTATGVSFQDVLVGSPDYVWQDPNSATLIMIKDPGDTPTTGMRLIVPFFGVEDAIVKTQNTTSAANHHNIFLFSGADTTIASKARVFGQNTSGSSTYAITYYTERMLYIVENGSYVADSKGSFNLVAGQYVSVTPGTGQYRYENGQLNLYKQRYSSPNGQNGYFYWQYIATVARYISSPQPFYVPLNSSGSPDTRYVGVNLTARDPKSSNRGYLATASLLSTQIDYRSRICSYQ